MATTSNPYNLTTASSVVTAQCFTKSYDLWTCYGATLVMLPLLMAVGVPGNILVLLVYSRRFPPSTFREFVRVLAWLDLACNLVAIPLVLSRALVNPGSTPPLAIATAVRYVSYTTLAASGFVLSVIAADRYLKICRPQKTGITIFRARLLCVIAVLTAFLMNIPACVINYYSEKKGPMSIFHSALTGFFFMAFTLSMVTLYSLVWHRLRSHARNMHKSSSGGKTVASAGESANRHALRTSKIFSAVTVLFFVSIVPHFLLFVVTSVRPNLRVSVLADLANVSPFINCMANPFVYSFTSPRFRRELCLVLQGLRPGGRLSSGPPTLTTSCSDHAPPSGQGVPESSGETSEKREGPSV